MNTPPTRRQIPVAPLSSRQIAELKRRQEAYKAATCKTCCDHGFIGGPSYYAPDEGGEPCPDCNPPAPSAGTCITPSPQGETDVPG